MSNSFEQKKFLNLGILLIQQTSIQVWFEVEIWTEIKTNLVS